MSMITKPFNSKIEFTNDGKLSFFFIGTGSAFSKINYQTNLLIIKGQDHILIDCGSLCPYALETSYNTRLSTIKNLLLTHPHADHIGGVEEIALVGYYVNKARPKIVITDEFKKKLLMRIKKRIVLLSLNQNLVGNSHMMKNCWEKW